MQEQYDFQHEQSPQPTDGPTLSDSIASPDGAQSATSTTSDRPNAGRDAERRPDMTSTAATRQVGGNDYKSPVSLVPPNMAREFMARWEELQTAFVDEPHRVVEQADSLVTEVMQRIADSLARERKSLEHQWASNDQMSTEELRLTLQHYRSLLQRLLS